MFCMIGAPADTDLPPAVRRRLERLEGQLGALTRSIDLLGKALARRGLVHSTPVLRPRRAERPEPAAGSKTPLPERGLAGAVTRGEALRVAWVRNGDLVPTERLAQGWG